MPNAKGGKNYKKGKNADAAPIMIDRVPGQMVGRVVRVLGNRNMLTYCNDKKLRICHICGKMKGRVIVATGDVVLLSLRDFGDETDRGDIIAKYPPEQHSSLKKEGINPNIFLKLEVMKNMTLDNIGVEDLPMTQDVDEDEFEFDYGIEVKNEVVEKEEKELNIDDI
jgi:translation initiation factor 1A